MTESSDGACSLPSISGKQTDKTSITPQGTMPPVETDPTKVNERDKNVKPGQHPSETDLHLPRLTPVSPSNSSVRSLSSADLITSEEHRRASRDIIVDIIQLMRQMKQKEDPLPPTSRGSLYDRITARRQSLQQVTLVYFHYNIGISSKLTWLPE